MFGPPHSLIVGWPLDEIGPVLCEHYDLIYDPDWRQDDSKATWHVKLSERLKEHKGVEVFIGWGENDWDEIKDGRFLIGVFYHLEGIEHTEEFDSLAPFLRYLKEQNVKPPVARNYFYAGDEACTWAVDCEEWPAFLER